jgi:hypothetical protein
MSSQRHPRPPRSSHRRASGTTPTLAMQSGAPSPLRGGKAAARVGVAARAGYPGVLAAAFAHLVRLETPTLALPSTGRELCIHAIWRSLPLEGRGDVGARLRQVGTATASPSPLRGGVRGGGWRFLPRRKLGSRVRLSLDTRCQRLSTPPRCCASGTTPTLAAAFPPRKGEGAMAAHVSGRLAPRAMPRRRTGQPPVMVNSVLIKPKN